MLGIVTRNYSNDSQINITVIRTERLSCPAIPICVVVRLE